MKFSERKGFKEVSKIIQIDDINVDLRTALWNIFYTKAIRHFNNVKAFRITYWASYEKKTLDSLPASLTNHIKKIFLAGKWYEVYDFLEFTLNYNELEQLAPLVNETLEKELSAYRFINGVVTDITDNQEIEMLEKALTDDDFPNVKAHLQRALELLSDRKNPDYRNSIKESISAVESIAKEIAQKPKVELGEALKEIEKKGKLHGAMKKAFLNLYGYTSDANGIRHALMEEPNLTADDAKFFLLTCTSFINYLKAKM
jgi:hypothetical protein